MQDTRPWSGRCEAFGEIEIKSRRTAAPHRPPVRGGEAQLHHPAGGDVGEAFSGQAAGQVVGGGQIAKLAETVELHDEQIKTITDVLRQMMAQPARPRELGFHTIRSRPGAPE